MQFADAPAIAGITAMAGALDVASVPAVAGVPADSLLLLLALRICL
jgi:hypothetical protein